MTEETNTTLDVREISPRERHSLIFRRLDSLKPSEAILLVNDHDPKPLYYQIVAERPDQFDWVPEQEGPEVWNIRITRRINTQ